jgi:hypothetical protein
MDRWIDGWKKSLPKEYKWEGQGANREKKKGRAIGGIITGVKLGIREKRQEKGKEEGCMERKVHGSGNLIFFNFFGIAVLCLICSQK